MRAEGSELITRVKYCNTLPDIPFDLKFITYPFENDRFIQYKPTSLERNYRYEVLTEHDLGVTIDLINRDLYQIDHLAVLDPADEKLLEEDIHTPQDSMRSSRHAKSVSWLRKSEYISTEQTRFQPQTMEKVEAKVGFNVKQSLREETLYMDREAQVKAIDKTFEDNKKEITAHYSKPGVVPVEVLPVFPDFANWKYPCAQVIFDFDPAPIGKNVPAQIEEMSQAMIRGVMDESGEQFVAYFLPTEETLEKRRRDLVNETLYEDEEEYEYKMAREYNWNVKSKASKGYEENYYLVLRQDGMYYNELETRVRLSKRRQKVGQPPNNTKLVVKHPAPEVVRPARAPDLAPEAAAAPAVVPARVAAAREVAQSRGPVPAPGPDRRPEVARAEAAVAVVRRGRAPLRVRIGVGPQQVGLAGFRRGKSVAQPLGKSFRQRG
ncbi:hypothetical protein pipiens_011057 [Culex pipiens pipiens]|uniref:RNA polymerase II-associated factor 1 homolog n=1 Tax=Culex pipiens pipiens TaxID=38569 RepID=A0ABD1D7U5_CULPP